MKKPLIFTGLAASILIISLFVLRPNFDELSPADKPDSSISSYEECVAAGYPILKSYPPQCRTPDGKHFTAKISEDEQPEAVSEISIQGQLVCLPHWDSSGPQTLECAYGIRDDEDNYYVADFSGLSQEKIVSMPMNTKVEVDGTFIPGPDAKYQSIGRIEINEINEINEL